VSNQLKLIIGGANGVENSSNLEPVDSEDNYNGSSGAKLPNL